MGSGFAFNIGRGFGAVVTPVTIGAMAKTQGLGFGIGACSVIFSLGALIVWSLPETLRQDDAAIAGSGSLKQAGVAGE